MSKKNRGSLFLLIAAFIWGVAFSAQKLGMESMDPFAFNAVRMVIGAAVCFVIYYIKSSYGGMAASSPFSFNLVKAGLLCGLCLFIASNLQQAGLVYTTPGKAGFITTLYIIIVPILGIFIGRIPKAVIWFCALLAVAGFFLMCIKEDFTLGRGDFLVLLCALAFSLHIVVVDRYAPQVDGILLSAMQFITCGVLGFVLSLVTEINGFAINSIIAALPALLYTGVLSSGIAYTFQILGQRDVPPALASLLMSFESVFSVVGGIIVFREVPSMREAIGCIMVFTAVVIAQKGES